MLVLFFVVRGYRKIQPPESKVEITGRVVDNRYNNYISGSSSADGPGDLVRIGDKLYFNYQGNYATYGLYEISSEGARRIYWEGHGPWDFLAGHGDSYYLYPIQEYGGALLMNTILPKGVNHRVYNADTEQWDFEKGCLQTYSEENQSFGEASLFGGISDIKALHFQETSFGFVYESWEEGDLWVYSEAEGPKQIETENVNAFYAVGEQAYYLTHNNPGDPYILRMYHFGEGTDTVIRQWTEYSGMSSIFIIDRNTVFFLARDAEKNVLSLYKLSLLDPAQKETAIFTIDKDGSGPKHLYSWNFWNGTVYICTEKGLIACDADTGAQRMLCDKPVFECDILDDTWVYFQELDSYALWRVPQSGGAAELVLG